MEPLKVDGKSEPRLDLVGPLCAAAFSGDIAAIKKVISEGADVNRDRFPHDSRTALHAAAAGGHLGAVKYLVEECGAQLLPDRYGAIPIHDAVHHSHDAIREFLQNIAIGENAVLSSLKRPANMNDDRFEQMAKVFCLMIKDGIFRWHKCSEEVQYYFTTLGFHPVYFETFSAEEVSRHLQILVAAKRTSHASHQDHVQVRYRRESDAVFMSTLGEDAVDEIMVSMGEFVSDCQQKGVGYNVVYMASEAPLSLYAGGKNFGGEKLGLWISTEQSLTNAHGEPLGLEEELNLVSKTTSIHTPTVTRELYSRLLSKVQDDRTAVIDILDGRDFPGPFPGGWVLPFAAHDHLGAGFLPELWQCFRYCKAFPKRYYVHTFSNGIKVYLCFFPHAQRQVIEHLAESLRYVMHFKATPGRSALVGGLLRRNEINPAQCVYMVSLAKFAYYFFPREESVGISTYSKLERSERARLDDLVSPERIFETVCRHPHFATQMFDDFREIVAGKHPIGYVNKDLEKRMSRMQNEVEAALLTSMLRFNQAIRGTNFFFDEPPGAMCYQFCPDVLLTNRSKQLYPDMPYSVFMAVGRGFTGFHVAFSDIARGGIRLQFTPHPDVYDRMQLELFDTTYALARQQHLKNKSIPEGGSKGSILLSLGKGTSSHENRRDCFAKYVDALVDVIQISSGDSAQDDHPQICMGPDDFTTQEMMDLGAERGKRRGYRHWRCLFTGKSPHYGGIPHHLNLMTTSGVRTYLRCLLKELNVKESHITKVMVGGPSSGRGSNEILESTAKVIAVVDNSGVAYDPFGLQRDELIRLAKSRQPIADFTPECLSQQGFLSKVTDRGPLQIGGETWLTPKRFRDEFLFTKYASADLLVPFERRTRVINGTNVHNLFNAAGVCRFKYIIEASDMFLSTEANLYLEKRGVHVFNDVSTTAAAVTASSAEAFAALCLPPDDHDELMCFTSPSPGQAETPFYKRFVEEVSKQIERNQEQEFKVIWRESLAKKLSKNEVTKKIAQRIITLADFMSASWTPEGNDKDLFLNALRRAVPQVMIERCGVDGVVRNVPSRFLHKFAANWIASQFVYLHGTDTSEFSFFMFLRNLRENQNRDLFSLLDDSTQVSKL